MWFNSTQGILSKILMRFTQLQTYYHNFKWDKVIFHERIIFYIFHYHIAVNYLFLHFDACSGGQTYFLIQFKLLIFYEKDPVLFFSKTIIKKYIVQVCINTRWITCSEHFYSPNKKTIFVIVHWGFYKQYQQKYNTRIFVPSLDHCIKNCFQFWGLQRNCTDQTYIILSPWF